MNIPVRASQPSSLPAPCSRNAPHPAPLVFPAPPCPLLPLGGSHSRASAQASLSTWGAVLALLGQLMRACRFCPAPTRRAPSQTRPGLRQPAFRNEALSVSPVPRPARSAGGVMETETACDRGPYILDGEPLRHSEASNNKAYWRVINHAENTSENGTRKREGDC